MSERSTSELRPAPVCTEVITHVDKHTDWVSQMSIEKSFPCWVSQMSIARHKSQDIRICIDPIPLNEALKREHYILPVLGDILPEWLKYHKLLSSLHVI